MYNIVGSTPNQAGPFRFYINGEATDHRFPLFKWNDSGVVLAILKGVTTNIINHDLIIAPVYQPLFIFDKRDALRIEIMGLRLTASKRWPPLYLERVTRKGDLE